MRSSLERLLSIILILLVTGSLPAGTVKQASGTPSGLPGDQREAPDYGLGITGIMTAQGLRITAVQNQNQARGLLLEPGDVIVAVNQYTLHSLKDWIESMSDGDGLLHLRIRNVQGGKIESYPLDLTR